MMKAAQLLLCLCAAVCSYSAVVQCQEESDSEIRDNYMAKLQQAVKEANATDTVIRGNFQEVPSQFACNTTKPQPFNPATNVHELTPWDVSIVAAMGDSVTAGVGAGAKSIIDAAVEYRWLSWSIGGHRDITEVSTLPNIIRKYNPNVEGYSEEGNKRLNVAVSGARARHMPQQAVQLVNDMKELFEHDETALNDAWKVITLWIGGNDLCAICSGSPEDHAIEYASHIQEALTYLSVNVKRAYINLAELIDVTKLADISGLDCKLFHFVLCRCGTQDSTKELVSLSSTFFNEQLTNMLKANNYFDRDDFTVALQPFFSGTKLPRTEDGKSDNSYFGPDCFHFSQKGHGVGALYLWNNMLEQGEKTDEIDWDNLQDYKCISPEMPYFSTNGNKNLLNSASAGDGKQGSTKTLLPILVGTSMGVFMIAMAVILVTVVVVRLRKRSSSEVKLEKLQLLATKL